MKKLLLTLALCMGYLCTTVAQTFIKTEVKQSMRRVADWQIAHYNKAVYGDLNWVNATFYLGLVHWAAIAEQTDKDDSYYKWLLRLGNRNYWQVDQRMYHADDICISQMYLYMYEKYKKKSMLIPTQARAEWVIDNPPSGSFKLNYGDASTLEHWTWCDALFMAPPVYMKLYNITGDKKFIRFMDKEYKATYDFLFDKEENLFYRDHRYFTMKEANGAKVFWGRGNGWVLGGLVEMLRELPAKSKYRPFYQDLFQKLCRRIAPLQNKDGFWHASLLDPDSYPSPETSCSGFFVYALAYGINEGLLSKEEFLPVVEKGWQALVSAVGEDGKLGYVQPIGADPKKVTPNMTEVYGPGAFLLAGTEVYRMAQDVPTVGNGIVQCVSMLDDHLSPEVRSRVLCAFREKVFRPVEEDLFCIDYTSAYSTPNLDKLIHTFVYDRQGEGSFTVGDEFTADTPIRFETAVTTQADWKIIDDTHLLLTSGTEQMIVNVEASGKVAFTSEIIEVNAPAYTRIGIALKEQSEKGYIRLKMRTKQL